ncbi:MAG: hypothetical protein JWN20_1760 [Jatrophihabitantaceae bacterium]|nr:hypothetical protein [Jatrophihabitantaceae bacterium]
MTASVPNLAICSAKGCRQPAETAIIWRNPTLHFGGRVKTWVACPEHVAHLSDFLARRDFFLHTEPLIPSS